MKPWPHTTVTFVSAGEAPGHTTRSVLVNGSPVTVEEGTVDISQPANNDVQRVTLTLLPDEIHFVGPDEGTPASTETARNGDLSDDEADQAPTDPPTRERPSAGDPDETLEKVIRDGVGKPSASDAEMWATAARDARKHILGGPDDEPMGVYRRRDVEAHRERAEKAEAERDVWEAKFEQTDTLLSRTRDERDKYATEAERWEHRHAAFRADVEACRNACQIEDILDRDDARDPQAD